MNRPPARLRVLGRTQVPIVMDELNFVKNIRHHYRAYGGWSFALKDYTDLGFTTYVRTCTRSSARSLVRACVRAFVRA